MKAAFPIIGVRIPTVIMRFKCNKCCRMSEQFHDFHKKYRIQNRGSVQSETITYVCSRTLHNKYTWESILLSESYTYSAQWHDRCLMITLIGFTRQFFGQHIVNLFTPGSSSFTFPRLLFSFDRKGFTAQTFKFVKIPSIHIHHNLLVSYFISADTLPLVKVHPFLHVFLKRYLWEFWKFRIFGNLKYTLLSLAALKSSSWSTIFEFLYNQQSLLQRRRKDAQSLHESITSRSSSTVWAGSTFASSYTSWLCDDDIGGYGSRKITTFESERRFGKGIGSTSISQEMSSSERGRFNTQNIILEEYHILTHEKK